MTEDYLNWTLRDDLIVNMSKWTAAQASVLKGGFLVTHVATCKNCAVYLLGTSTSQVGGNRGAALKHGIQPVSKRFK